ncbi:MAG: hypothetical protein IKB01_09735 [Lachnospiraceae bacterium]|nr:hypothetical protein [Lachnospiraceae bacterium]
MKKYKLLKKLGVWCLLFATVVSSIPITVYAKTAEANTFANVSENRESEDQEKLKAVYKELFPNEYHYIVEYEKYGVKEMPDVDIETIFYGAVPCEGFEYELIVMNNGQVFLNYSGLSELQTVGKERYAVNGTFYSKDFTVGDIGHYVTFTIDYLICQMDYDSIITCRGAYGDGFYLYPTNLSKKLTEDTEGPAYYGYNNVSMNLDGSGVLYDIGVAVGNNKAKGITQISRGVDMWLWTFLYAFFFGD